MSWVTASDQTTLDSTKQVRIHIALSCIVNPSADAVKEAFLAANSISSVSDFGTDLSASVLNPLSFATQYYVASVSVYDGVQAGTLRADIISTLNVLSQNSGISCSQFTVGTIEFDDGLGYFSGVGAGIGSGLSQAQCLARGGDWDATNQKCNIGGLSLSTTLVILAVAAVIIVGIVAIKV
jgi:hypothetical protein